MPNFLYLSHIAPFPPYGGERLRALGLLTLLRGLGEVTAVVQSSQTPLYPRSGPLADVRWCPFDFQAAMRPGLRYFFQEPRLIQHLESVLTSGKPDAVFLDYQFYGTLIAWFQARGLPVIYGTHNAEARLTLIEAQRTQGLRRAKKTLLWALQAAHERRYFPCAEGFVSVSAEDDAYYGRFVARARRLVLPNFLVDEPLAPREPIQREPRTLVVTGNFTVFQNQAGVEWFLGEVWQPQDLAKRYRLLLVGRGSDTFLREWSASSGQNPEKLCVTATGGVDDLVAACAEAWVALVPLRHGSGTRLKILEAWRLGLPVLSTPLGAEGLAVVEGESAALARTAEEFVEALRKLEDPDFYRRLTVGGQALLRREYLLAPNIVRFNTFLRQILPSLP